MRNVYLTKCSTLVYGSISMGNLSSHDIFLFPYVNICLVNIWILYDCEFWGPVYFVSSFMVYVYNAVQFVVVLSCSKEILAVQITSVLVSRT